LLALVVANPKGRQRYDLDNIIELFTAFEASDYINGFARLSTAIFESSWKEPPHRHLHRPRTSSSGFDRNGKRNCNSNVNRGNGMGILPPRDKLMRTRLLWLPKLPHLYPQQESKLGLVLGQAQAYRKANSQRVRTKRTSLHPRSP
jgi:hypothetical protein